MSEDKKVSKTQVVVNVGDLPDRTSVPDAAALSEIFGGGKPGASTCPNHCNEDSKCVSDCGPATAGFHWECYQGDCTQRPNC